MDNLKQLWSISIDPSEVEKRNNILKMKHKGFKVKQLGHFIESAKNGYYHSRGTDKEMIKKIMNDVPTITSNDLKNANSLFS